MWVVAGEWSTLVPGRAGASGGGGAPRRKFPMIYRRGSMAPGRHTRVAETFSTLQGVLSVKVKSETGILKKVLMGCGGASWVQR